MKSALGCIPSAGRNIEEYLLKLSIGCINHLTGKDS